MCDYTQRRHEHIKMQLRVRGSSLAAIAREVGVGKSTVTMVSQGRRRSERVEAAIATKLSIPRLMLWSSSQTEKLLEQGASCQCLMGAAQ